MEEVDEQRHVFIVCGWCFYRCFNCIFETSVQWKKYWQSGSLSFHRANYRCVMYNINTVFKEASIAFDRIGDNSDCLRWVGT